ncbi:hypothetical protein EYR41_004321 [Orbilia oligospora]|uniref:Uncharacterized protein n=1 Tax=Orbilia oligospora TaxID=2813651 RepID=A0A7C8KTB8_ORBOL|nr:hypothetical protein TWF751_005134 [Orbilia oligospora]TGJ72425.1 hypothetical protein EYR41_004321 [Orbilia oligospora]
MSEIPPNLLLNPRAYVLSSSTAPLSTVPSTNPPSSLTVNEPVDPTARLSPEEEQTRLSAALADKATGNTHFTSTPPDYETAISYYRSALESCPAYLTEHTTILHANIAASFIKLSRWKEAEEAATNSLKVSGEDDDILREREAIKRQKEEKEKKEKEGKSIEGGKGAGVQDTSNGRIEEVEDDDEEHIEWGKNWKARLRRAKAREMQNTWQSLSGSLEDYKILSSRSARFQSIPSIDRKAIEQALVRIPPVLEEKKQKEMAEMMGKLKGLGDTILRPFGLSTSNFQMVKDEKSGGYSLNFQQNSEKK